MLNDLHFDGSRSYKSGGVNDADETFQGNRITHRQPVYFDAMLLFLSAM